MTEVEWLELQEREHNLRTFQIQPRKRGPKEKEFEPWQLRVAREWADRKVNA